MSLYTVISPRAEYFDEYLDFIKSYSKVKIDLCIQEFGTGGDHPHLNIIWAKDVVGRTCKFTEKLKRHMKNLPDIESPVIIRTTNIKDVKQLIGGYLQKEDNYEVIIDTKVYSVEELKGVYGMKWKNKAKWNGIMNFSTAPLEIYDFCVENKINYVAFAQHRYAAHRDNKPYDYCRDVMAAMMSKYKVQVHHLWRKAEEIDYAVKNLFSPVKLNGLEAQVEEEN